MKVFEQFLLVMAAADGLNEEKEKAGEKFGKDLLTVRDIAFLDALLTGAPYSIREGSMSVLVNGKEYLISAEQFERMTKKSVRGMIAEKELDAPEEVRLSVPCKRPATGEELMRRLIVLETAYGLRDKRLYVPDLPEGAFRFREEDTLDIIGTLQDANEDHAGRRGTAQPCARCTEEDHGRAVGLLCLPSEELLRLIRGRK